MKLRFAGNFCYLTAHTNSARQSRGDVVTIRSLPIIPFALFAALANPSCTRQQRPETSSEAVVRSKNDLVIFLDSLERRYEQACIGVGLANWSVYSGEGGYDLDRAKEEMAKIFSDSTARAIVQEWRNRSNSLADKELARRLELWRRAFTGGSIYSDLEIARLEDTLQKKITKFMFTYQGSSMTRAAITEQLRQERRDEKRHTLWAAASQLSEAAASDLRSLVALRNQKARLAGFPNYYSLTLHLNAIDEEWLLKTIDLLEKETRAKLEDFILSSRKKYRLKELGPWDFDFALRETALLPDKFFPRDSVFDILHRFQRGLGFRTDSLPIRESVKDIPYGGLNLAIRIPDDTRFMVNPASGQRFYQVAFHEYGHALKAVFTNVGFPILKGYEWIPGAQCSAYEEGVADMQSEFTEDSVWLDTFTGARPRLISKYLRTRALPDIYRLRRTMKDFFVEYELYKNPSGDMAAVERAMYKRFLLVDIDSAEAPQFASSIWYTSYPCYFQNYIMARMIATQLQEALTGKFGPERMSSPAVSQWIISHLYAQGEKQEWPERIRNATGKGLEPGALLRKLGIDQSHLITEK